MAWYFYILRCCDGRLYIGHTANLRYRLWYHNAGLGAQFTRLRRPVRLVYHERFETKLPSIHREKQVKRWTRQKKEALIRGDLDTLKWASKRKA